MKVKKEKAHFSPSNNLRNCFAWNLCCERNMRNNESFISLTAVFQVCDKRRCVSEKIQFLCFFLPIEINTKFRFFLGKKRLHIRRLRGNSKSTCQLRICYLRRFFSPQTKRNEIFVRIDSPFRHSSFLHISCWKRIMFSRQDLSSSGSTVLAFPILILWIEFQEMENDDDKMKTEMNGERLKSFSNHVFHLISFIKRKLNLLFSHHFHPTLRHRYLWQLIRSYPAFFSASALSFHW